MLAPLSVINGMFVNGIFHSSSMASTLLAMAGPVGFQERGLSATQTIALKGLHLIPSELKD